MALIIFLIQQSITNQAQRNNIHDGKLNINGVKGNSDNGRGKEREAHKLSVFYTNSRSVINKIDTLRGIACVEELDIIGITKTWLDIAGKHFLPEVGINGYTFFTGIE